MADEDKTSEASEKGCCSNILRNLFRKKNVSEDMMRRDLRRCFNLGDLTFLAISGMMGSGLYVLAGTVTKNITGPSIVVSYVVAALASILSALCYAEFAARIPVAGSAYQFTYLSVGEFWAFIVGWNVALEHTIYVAAIAKTCSGYLDGLFGMAIRNYMMEHTPMPGGFVSTYPDFLAAALILVFALVLIAGVKLSSKINIAIASLNVCTITFIIVTGIILCDWDNWTNVRGGFFPYGWAGTISGSTTLVYSYVGYEVVASATEEALNAGRDIPMSLFISITVVVIAYVGASAALTLMVPWYDVSVITPYPSAYAQRGWYWARYVVSIGALAAMLTCLLSIMFVVPRYLLAMARDGLIWKFFKKIHSKTQVPYVSTLIVATVSSIMAIIFSLTTLVEFIAVGQLLACTFVGICVIRLRYSPNEISTYKRADQCTEDELNDSTELRKVVTSSSENLKSEPNEKSMLCRDTKRTTTAAVGSVTSSSDASTSGYDPIGDDDDTKGLLSSQFGTVKKSLLNSPHRWLFEWTLKYEAGDVPLYCLLLAIFCSTLASILLLFVTFEVKQWWFDVIVGILILVAVFSISFLKCFIQDDTIPTFKVPFVPFLPFASIVINILLMLKLQPLTWIRFGVWMVFGLAIYFGYGYRNSKARVKEE